MHPDMIGTISHFVRTRSLLAGLVLASVTSSAATVNLNLTFGWQKQLIAVPSAPVSTPAGQTLSITRIAGLISDVELVRADGTSLQLVNQYGFFDAENPDHHNIILHSVPEGEYTGMKFRVGVAPDANHSDPSLWSADHALNPILNGLHWNWAGGYVFLAIEGHYADAPDAARAGGFSFHLATDKLPLPVRFERKFSITGDSEITLLFDVADFLGDLRLDPETDTTTTHSREGDTLAPKLAEAVGPSFWFGNATPTEIDLATTEPDSPASIAAPLPFNVPAGWPQPALPHDNAPTAPGTALGEKLFHDPRLSGDNSQSCVDCHQTRYALTDNATFSLGIHGTPGTRNAMPLFNLAWSPDFAWDGSQPRIRDQSIAALTNPIEMDGDPDVVVATLAKDPTLREAFAATFGDDAVTLERIGLALEQFLLTEVSADSRFDKTIRGEAELTPLETRGLELFNTEFDPRREQFGADCFHCHGGGLFTDFAHKNNGLDLVSIDPGRQGVTGAESDAGKFKTPSLRNIALTAPYMHDGRFETLEEVVQHYIRGVKRVDQLDPNLAKHPGSGVPLRPGDQAALVAFLKTLTDPRYAEAN
ncbi:MAG: hypothetical protein SynsKO_07520 [Synoicihabitans sp.]